MMTSTARIRFPTSFTRILPARHLYRPWRAWGVRGACAPTQESSFYRPVKAPVVAAGNPPSRLATPDTDRNASEHAVQAATLFPCALGRTLCHGPSARSSESGWSCGGPWPISLWGLWTREHHAATSSGLGCPRPVLCWQSPPWSLTMTQPTLGGCMATNKPHATQPRAPHAPRRPSMDAA